MHYTWTDTLKGLLCNTLDIVCYSYKTTNQGSGNIVGPIDFRILRYLLNWETYAFHFGGTQSCLQRKMAGCVDNYGVRLGSLEILNDSATHEKKTWHSKATVDMWRKMSLFSIKCWSIFKGQYFKLSFLMSHCRVAFSYRVSPCRDKNGATVRHAKRQLSKAVYHAACRFLLSQSHVVCGIVISSA